MGRRTKIVCTLGPATDSTDAIRALIDAGMDVARLNFSHGSRESHARTYERVRAVASAAGRQVAVLADLQGPKIRLRTFAGGAAVLEPGSMFVVSGELFEGTNERASVTYASLARDVAPGDTVLIADGTVKLQALSSDGHNLSCRVLEGGPLSDAKGVNLPGSRLAAPALTEKDVEDLRFALDLGVDAIALSFVRHAEDAAAVYAVMDDVGRRVPVIAKIEKPEAVESLEEITEAFDGLMVARGDLGVEIPLEQVPIVQKRAVQLARERSKPAIVATQMLESMVHNRRPTRAEVSDVANAVLDGADALMLADETSVGEYPVETVATMARIVQGIEEAAGGRIAPLEQWARTQQEAVSAAAVRTGAAVGATALVALTQTGRTARCLARHRSPIPLVALTSNPAVPRQLALTWDTRPHLVPSVGREAEELAQVDAVLLGEGHQVGDRVVIVSGDTGRAGSTHTMRVHELRG